MREFFKSELKDLHITTGLLQYFKLSEMTDEKGNPDGERQLTVLLNELVDTCNDFPYIPDEDKKSIVKRYKRKDPDFIGFNSKILYKWFNLESGKYFRELSHTPIEPNAKEVSYDNLPIETKRMFDDFVKQLQTPSKFKVPTVTQEELDDIKIEDLEHVEGKKSISAGYKTNPEQIILHDLRIKWMRECTDPLTGKLKEGCLSWEEWSRR